VIWKGLYRYKYSILYHRDAAATGYTKCTIARDSRFHEDILRAIAAYAYQRTIDSN